MRCRYFVYITDSHKEELIRNFRCVNSKPNLVLNADSISLIIIYLFLVQSSLRCYKQRSLVAPVRTIVFSLVGKVFVKYKIT